MNEIKEIFTKHLGSNFLSYSLHYNIYFQAINLTDCSRWNVVKEK